ncbi:prtrc system protein e [Chitinophaga caeni]|uniref:Prtrc system protein e n=1 Tax=Chitinophaga caeni TaxID=2029983 RepID=A0A291QYJ0_9BACT|nr:PRTRC system protein E [Chitinophaga caeni]ATL48934.1 prtrc system protein e [Chitinophaga caeni]
MNTSFFQQIAQLNITGALQITITKGAGGGLVVSVILHNEQCGDKAKELIPPLTLRGTAEELDSGFFERITAPIQATSGLMDNMETYLKQQEEAKKQSAMEKEKTDKEKKAKEERDRKYKEAMKKVDELEKEGKYREAWTKVPDPNTFPEYADTIRKRRAALSAQFPPDLFGGAEPEAEATTPEANLFSVDDDTATAPEVPEAESETE